MTMPGWGNTHTCVRTLPCDAGKPEHNASCKVLGLQCRCEDSESRHHPLRSLRLTTSSGRLYEPKGTYSTLGHRSKLASWSSNLQRATLSSILNLYLVLWYVQSD